MPLQRRVPKRGFHNIFRVEYQIVNVKDLERFPADAGVGVDGLREAGLINKKGMPVKLLGSGEINRAAQDRSSRVHEEGKGTRGKGRRRDPNHWIVIRSLTNDFKNSGNF